MSGINSALTLLISPPTAFSASAAVVNVQGAAETLRVSDDKPEKSPNANLTEPRIAGLIFSISRVSIDSELATIRPANIPFGSPSINTRATRPIRSNPEA